MASVRPLSSASFYLDEVVQGACEIGAHDDDHHGRRVLDSSSSASSSLDSPDAGRSTRRLTPPFVARGQKPRPQVTLRYMQSLDGSLTVGERSHLPDVRSTGREGDVCESMECAGGAVVHFVGRLRSNHDAILVGLNTVMRDDPELLSGHPSRQPQPVVLDTELQFPIASSKLMLQARLPWIFCRVGLEASPQKAALESAGVRVFHVPLDQNNALLDLESVLSVLYNDLDIQRLVVEGGVSVLENFIRRKLFDKLVVLIAPCFGVGRALFQTQDGEEAAAGIRAEMPLLSNIRYDVLGTDLVMSAEPLLQ